MCISRSLAVNDVWVHCLHVKPFLLVGHYHPQIYCNPSPWIQHHGLIVGFPNWHVSGCQLGEETPLHSPIWLWRLLEPSNLVAPPKKYTFRIGTCIESIFAVDSSFISAVGAELELSYGRSQFCWRPQPILLRLHHSICSNFSSISRPSCSQFACRLPISRRPILGQCLWWNWQYLRPFDSVSCIIWHNLSLAASMRSIGIQKALQGKSVFIKFFWNGWSNLNDSFGKPPWKLDADEMLKKSAL